MILSLTPSDPISRAAASDTEAGNNASDSAVWTCCCTSCLRTGQPQPFHPTGVSDNFNDSGFQWSQPGGLGEPVTITYSFSNLFDGELGGNTTTSQLEAAVEEALGLWAEYAPLNFVEIEDSGPDPSQDSYPAADHADIRFGYDFIDGSSSTLAFAYLPFSTTNGLAGDVTFDSSENWSLNPTEGIDFLEVAVHEIGHALGLGHEPFGGNDAIMQPFYGGRYSGLGSAFLFDDDINGIRAIYGTGVGSVTPLSDGNGPTLNLGFETGDFTDWNVAGDTAVTMAMFGVTPTERLYQAVLTTDEGAVNDTELETLLGLSAGALDGFGNGDAIEGSAMQLMSLEVEAGDVLSFDWNFLTNEEASRPAFNDFGFFSIAGNLFELANINSSFVSLSGDYDAETGYGTLNYLFTEAGTFDIGFGVVDVSDGSSDSALLVDNLAVTQLNGGFETGDFTHWQTIGDAGIETAAFGADPTAGTHQALLTTSNGAVSDAALESFLGLSAGALDGLGNGDAIEGSAMQLMPITVNAGDVLTFDWNFLTNEGTPDAFGHNDFSFVTISAAGVSALADTNSSFTPLRNSFNSQTGYGTFTYQFAEAGTYTIGLGVADVLDGAIDSALLVDNLQIAELNGSFETGDFAHWDVIGVSSIETAALGSIPTAGDYQALLTTESGAVSDSELENFLGLNAGDLDGLGNGDAIEGSAMQLTPITVEAGQVLTFDWNFLTNEDISAGTDGDFGFVSIASESLDILNDSGDSFIDSQTISFGSETGYGTFTYEFTEAGTYQLGLGVVDIGDGLVDSGMLIDNVAIA